MELIRSAYKNSIGPKKWLCGLVEILGEYRSKISSEEKERVLKSAFNFLH